MDLEGEPKMCEFRVYLGGKEVFRDVIYAKQEGDILLLRDVLGDARKLPGTMISEVDVSASTMVLGELK